MEESPIFKGAIARERPERVPLAAVLRQRKVSALQVLLCAMAESSTFYFSSVFGLSYGLRTLGLSNSLLLGGVVVGNAAGILAMPMFGTISDPHWPPPASRRCTSAVRALCTPGTLPLLATRNPAIVVLAMAVPGAILQPMSLAVTGSFYPELFDDPKLRLSGVSLGRQFGTILGGGLMPMIATSLLAMSGGKLSWVIGYFVLVCLMAVAAVLSTRETAARFGKAP